MLETQDEILEWIKAHWGSFFEVASASQIATSQTSLLIL